MVRQKSRIGSGRQKIVEICRKSFHDGGCVNDADLDDVEELIRSRIMK